MGANNSFIFIMLGILCILAFGVIAWYVLNVPHSQISLPNPTPSPTPDIKVVDTGGTRPLTAKERLEEKYDINRDAYHVSLAGYYDTFGSLPKAPEDFGLVTYEVYTGRKTDLNISSNYYLQPEFYPLFIENGLKKFYEVYDARYVGTFGWGVYPSEQWMDVVKGTKGQIRFLFKTGWGIETWQGMNLKASSNCDWLKTEIKNSTFLTPPTYPVFCTVSNCGENWARLISIDFEVSDNAKIGDTCIIDLSTVLPPSDKIKEWSDKYDILYVNASSSSVAVGVPFQGHVKVVETVE